MRKVLFATTLALLGTQVNAADVGLGVSIQSDDSWIYVPIDIASKVRIEPSLRFVDSDSTTTSQDVSFGLPFTTTVHSDARTYEFAVGVFGLAGLGENVSVYYGARAAYIESKSTLHGRAQYGNFVDEFTEERKTDGFRLSPTLGFEYAFNKHVSIGGEAEWFYEDVDSDLEQTDDVPYESKGERTGTDTRLILRFRF